MFPPSRETCSPVQEQMSALVSRLADRPGDPRQCGHLNCPNTGERRRYFLQSASADYSPAGLLGQCKRCKDGCSARSAALSIGGDTQASETVPPASHSHRTNPSEITSGLTRSTRTSSVTRLAEGCISGRSKARQHWPVSNVLELEQPLRPKLIIQDLYRHSKHNTASFGVGGGDKRVLCG